LIIIINLKNQIKRNERGIRLNGYGRQILSRSIFSTRIECSSYQLYELRFSWQVYKTNSSCWYFEFQNLSGRELKGLPTS